MTVAMKFVALAEILIALFVILRIIQNNRRNAEQKKRKNAEQKKRKIAIFRKIYNLSDDTLVYQSNGIISISPMNPTDHEKNLAEYIANSGFFNTNYVFLDYYFRDNKGKIRQIDLLAVGKRGVFVFESKDYQGWIFGSGNQFKWTQTLNGQKYHFYNPVKQNAAHIYALKDVLDTDFKFYSIVVFSSNATLKQIDFIPHDTYVVSGYRLNEALQDIANSQPELLTKSQVVSICKKINERRLIRDDALVKEHVDNIDDLTGRKRIYV